MGDAEEPAAAAAAIEHVIVPSESGLAEHEPVDAVADETHEAVHDLAEDVAALRAEGEGEWRSQLLTRLESISGEIAALRESHTSNHQLLSSLQEQAAEIQRAISSPVSAAEREAEQEAATLETVALEPPAEVLEAAGEAAGAEQNGDQGARVRSGRTVRRILSRGRG